MDYLLDTNAVSDLAGENARVIARLSALAPTDRVLTCAVVRGELLYGLRRLPPGQRRSDLERKVIGVLGGLPCEAVTPAVADKYAEVKATRMQKGWPLDDNDCWIASTALIVGATLVSRDRDFGQIERLRVEDWSA